MRIALIGSRGYPAVYGGYETFVRELVPRTVRRGQELVVYCRESPNGARRWSVNGAECVLTRGVDDYHLSQLSYGLTSCLDVRGREVDAAVVVNLGNGFWLPLVRRAGVPIVVNVDGLEWERGKWGAIGRNAFKAGAAMTARYADALVADSRAIAGIWEERFGVRPHYIPYGADLDDSDEDDELAKIGVKRGEYTLTVARVVPENNVLMTLDALDRLPSGARPVHVVVGSGFGSQLDQALRTRAAARHDIRHLGQVKDQRRLAQLFRHCRLYVHGHSVGGTNPSLLQAMGAGAPSLAYDSPFTREVLGDDIDVYYEDADSLAEQMLRLLDSESLSDELAAHGRRRVAERYNWSEVCDAYLDLIGDLTGKRASVAAAETLAA
jgi:glycosyltransferase involved in cell wall biosynthesis